MANSLEILRKNVERLLLLRRINRKQLAQRCGWRPQDLNRLMNEPHHPRLDRLDELAEGLQVETWELLRDPDQADTEQDFEKALKTIIEGGQAYLEKKKKSGK